MILIFIFNIVENLQSLFRTCRLNHHLLETTLQSTVFLYILAVFIERCGTDALYFTTGKSRFQQVRGIHRTGCITGPHNSVEFINEQYHIGTFRQFGQNRLDALLKLATVFRAGHYRSHVERHHPLVKQYTRHFSFNDAQCQPFDNRRFSHTGFSDKNRIVFFAAAQNLRQTFNLILTPDNRIKTSVFRRTRYIVAELVEGRSIIVAAPTLRFPFRGIVAFVIRRGRTRLSVLILIIFLLICCAET